MRELIALAKAKPGELSYGTSGIGGSSHLAGAMLENVTGTQMINVPFKGNGPGARRGDGGAGDLHVLSGRRHRRPGRRRSKLKVLAVGTAERHPDFPGVPTMAEAGLPGFEATAPWVGMLAPAGTPAAVVNRLSEEMRKSLARPETREA